MRQTQAKATKAERASFSEDGGRPGRLTASILESQIEKRKGRHLDTGYLNTDRFNKVPQYNGTTIADNNVLYTVKIRRKKPMRSRY